MNDGEFTVDILDTSGQKSGKKLRKDIVKGKDIYHAVYVVVLSPEGKIILNKIAAREDMPNLHAGSYGCTAATIKRTGESGAEAAQRALKNELGIKQSPELLLEDFIEIDDTYRLVGLYTVTAPMPDSYNREDIEELVMLSPEEFEQTLQSTPQKITPMLRMFWDKKGFKTD